MMEGAIISWLSAGVPLLGAVLSLAVWSKPDRLKVSAILLPLVPFHEGHVTALTRLPGGLPSFIVLLLPALGVHGLTTVVAAVPEVAARTVSLFALAGSLYGAIKALAQSRVRLLLAYSSLSFFSILWWFVAAARTPMPRVAVFVGAVGLVT